MKWPVLNITYLRSPFSYLLMPLYYWLYIFYPSNMSTYLKRHFIYLVQNFCIYNMLCHIFAAWIMFPTKITILKSTLTCIFSICFFISATNWLFTTKLTMLVDSPIMYIFNSFYYWTYNVDRYQNMYIVVLMFLSICSVISARYGLCFLQKSQSW